MIKFYSKTGDYGCFSNFYTCTFTYASVRYKSAEHAFQSKKFAGTKYEKKVREAGSPMIAANLGRNRSFPLRRDWESVKDNIMREIIFAKFSQNSDLKQILLSTGSEKIVENTTDDYYWGCGESGGGKNMLGIILMETREKLK